MAAGHEEHGTYLMPEPEKLRVTEPYPAEKKIYIHFRPKEETCGWISDEVIYSEFVLHLDPKSDEKSTYTRPKTTSFEQLTIDASVEEAELFDGGDFPYGIDEEDEGTNFVYNMYKEHLDGATAQKAEFDKYLDFRNYIRKEYAKLSRREQVFGCEAESMPGLVKEIEARLSDGVVTYGTTGRTPQDQQDINEIAIILDYMDKLASNMPFEDDFGRKPIWERDNWRFFFEVLNGDISEPDLFVSEYIAYMCCRIFGKEDIAQDHLKKIEYAKQELLSYEIDQILALSAVEDAESADLEVPQIKKEKPGIDEQTLRLLNETMRLRSEGTDMD